MHAEKAIVVIKKYIDYIYPVIWQYFCTCFGSTYTKIGTIQRRLAWPLRKDDTQIREAFHILFILFARLLCIQGFERKSN